MSHSQYKPLYTISNSIEVYEERVPWTKKIPHCAVKFEASEKNRIVYESLYCYTANENYVIITEGWKFEIVKKILLL